MISEHKSKSYNPGQIDWIYWLDLTSWDNALVIQNKNDQYHNQLEFYFKNVNFASVTSPDEFEKTFNDEELNKTEFDLIFCTDLLEQFGAYPQKIGKYIERLSTILSNNGKIVIGYLYGLKLVTFVIDKLLTADTTLRHLNVSNFRWSQKTASAVFEYLEQNEFCQPYQSLYVYPSHRKPWTISNRELFATKIHEWKRKTRRNALVLKLISSKLGARTLKIWWPYRILLISKMFNNAQAHLE
jgi:hypothetical protein